MTEKEVESIMTASVLETYSWTLAIISILSHFTPVIAIRRNVLFAS